MLMLRTPLQPPEITEEIRARFATIEEPEALTDPSAVTAVATKGDIGVPGELMARLPALKLIAVYGVGVDRIDLEQAHDRGIVVTTTPGVLTDAVAEHAIALMFAASRRIVEGDTHVRSGAWASGKLGLGHSLRGKTLGILGYGRIGKRVAELARGLGMEVLYTSRPLMMGEAEGYRRTPKDLARDSDVLVITVAGGPQTRRIVNAGVLQALGPDGLLVNVARGSVVNEEDLITALRTRTIRGAALDVFEGEPTPRDDYLSLANLVLTPHIASATLEARQAMGRLVIDNLAAFFEGRELITPFEAKPWSGSLQ